MLCLNEEYARGKANNAKNDVRDKGARRQGGKGRSVRRTGAVALRALPPVVPYSPVRWWLWGLG